VPQSPAGLPELLAQVARLDRARRIDALRDDQRRRWERGERLPAEAYLRLAPSLETDEELLVELAYGEFLLREQGGEAPDSQEYLRRFPRCRAALERQFSVHRALADDPSRAGGRTTIPVAASPTVAPQLTPPPSPAPGQHAFPRVPGYDILGILGRGGMGVVYRARQLSLNRVVALKMIRAGAHAEAEELARFRREAEAVALFQHANIIQIHEVGEHDGLPYFSLEYAAGGSLAKRLTESPPSFRESAELLAVLARAVQAAHDKDIVHRDLKPANVLLTADGTPKIADFGLAKLVGEGSTLLAGAPTLPGAIVGTPSYMAPEQAGAQGQVGPAADVYALGAILYECLTGRPPFKGATTADTLVMVRCDDPIPPRQLRREVPRGLEAICLKCLAKSPRGRYATALELAEDLRRFLADRPLVARSRPWYEKTWRGMRAHPVLSMSVALLLLSMGATPLALSRLDPHRPRKQAEALLARGEPYRFEADDSLPGPFRWVLGDAGLPKRNANERCITAESLDLGLLELVSDPGCERYRFLVELRHDAAGGESFVGLYCGYREHGVNPNTRQGCFFTFSFADRGAAARAGREQNGRLSSAVALECRCFSETNAKLYAPHGAIGKGKAFEPAEPIEGPGPWRTLELDVSPEGVKALWGPETGILEVVEEVPAADLESHVRRRKGFPTQLLDVPSDFRPRSGLGLYIFSGKTSFRRMVLQPL
jgi:serine/threonine-protein kinase